MERLSREAKAAALAALPEWRLAGVGDGDAIARSFRFRDFSQAWAFMARVALAAEKADHHPDWRNSWNRVDISLSTHDAGGITARDFALAEVIDRLAAEAGGTPPPQG